MHQIKHIKKNKKIILQRAEIIKVIREFFWKQNFIEINAPVLVPYPGQEPNIEPMLIKIHDDRKKSFQKFLHTSPEFTMKKALAAGIGACFSLGPCFRDYESFEGLHHPEFTMLEWYRPNADFMSIMDDTETLITSLGKSFAPESILIKPWKRVHMRDLWKEKLDINLDEYLSKEKLFILCVEKKLNPCTADSFVELFYRVFLTFIEPDLGKDAPTIIHHYPKQMAALAKMSTSDPLYAERIEVYINGMEIANGFSELTNADEQKKRFEKEQNTRKQQNKNVYPIDQEFLEAIDNLPECAGIALGVDRLVMLLTGCHDIKNVLVLPLNT